MPGHTIKVGNVELVSLSDGTPVTSPFIPFPDTTIEQWREFPGLLDSNDQIISRSGAVAVRSEGKSIVVDTGLQALDGTLMDDMSRTRHRVLDMLESEGIHVSAGHFPDPGFGHFVRGESRRMWRGI